MIFFEVRATVLIDQIFPKTVHDAMNKSFFVFVCKI